jgi:hypothetical protein
MLASLARMCIPPKNTIVFFGLKGTKPATNAQTKKEKKMKKTIRKEK